MISFLNVLAPKVERYLNNLFFPNKVEKREEKMIPKVCLSEKFLRKMNLVNDLINIVSRRKIF